VIVSARSVRYAAYPRIGSSSAVGLLTAALFSLCVAIVCGTAWWKIWKRKASARAGGIAASMMNVAVYVRANVVYPGHHWVLHLGALFIGLIGLIVLLRPNNRVESAD
jgi:hypothetical protein